MAAFGLWSTQVKGGTFYWDTDTSTAGNLITGAGLGGTGTWDTGTANWWDLTNLVAWPNLNTDTAVFGGTAGTVTLSSGITANALSFKSTGYVLTGGDLTLGGHDADGAGGHGHHFSHCEPGAGNCRADEDGVGNPATDQCDQRLHGCHHD